MWRNCWGGRGRGVRDGGMGGYKGGVFVYRCWDWMDIKYLHSISLGEKLGMSI